MTLRSRHLSCVLVAALLSACNADAPDPRAQAKIVADAYVQQKGASDLLRRSVTVADRGSQWEVTYNLPEGYAGGDCVIGVDKRTMKVATHVCEQ